MLSDTLSSTTPAIGRPQLHPSWRETMPIDRPYINHRLAALVVLRARGDTTAAEEIERREKVRRIMDAALRRWPGFAPAAEPDDRSEGSAA